MPSLRFLICLPLALAGCQSDQGLGKYEGHDGTEGPVIEVWPRELDFGALAAGDVATQQFSVTNIGVEGSILEVSDIRLTGPAGGYTVVSGSTSFSLTPEDPAQVIDVAFTPMGANAQLSQAIVDSNDEASPHVAVDLAGEGLVPELAIDPDPLDMGETYVGCVKENVITLTNIGTDLLIVSDLSHAGPSDVFTFSNPNTMPLELDPGESSEVYLEFWPQEDVDYATQLVATSNEPLGVRMSDQTGRGAYAGEYTDEYEVPADPAVDILFYVDQSCSMDDDQAALADNFSAFISQLSAYTEDWQIMVVNDDDGCTNSGILTPSTPNYQSQFNRAVGQGGGTWTEAGLTVSTNALENVGGSDCNAGFMRSGALLHLVMVSDEPEQSRNSWDHYVNRAFAIKGDSSLVKYSAVAGDYPGGCTSSTNSAEPGTGYYEAVNYTGGVFLSICSSWGSNVEALADASIAQSSFALTHTPVPDTIVVTVNGVTASGWHYDSTTNSVVFDSSPPGEGAVVVIDYAGAANCD